MGEPQLPRGDGMSQDKPIVMVVDNEIEICNLFKDFFDFIGYQTIVDTDGEKVLHNLDKYEYDLMFVDLKLDSISGVEILRKSKVLHPDAEVIVVTGFGSEETVLKTLEHGAFSYIQKPISFSDIRIQAEDALAKRRFNARTTKIRNLLEKVDPSLARHMENLTNLDRLSIFVNLSIDMESLADSILSGTSGILPGYYYSFLHFDEINREMVVYSDKPVGHNLTEKIESQMRVFFESLLNREVTEPFNLRVSQSSELDEDLSEPVKISSFFVPIMVENTICGALGVSYTGSTLGEDEQDILRLISFRVNRVIGNATVHRDTKMLALTDGLTGLLNHRAIHERIRQEFDRFRRYGACLSLIVADFDDLKTFNDTYGHPVGDEVLRTLGDILRETSRESDVLARYGGDEFVILLPQTNSRNAYKMAERIRQRVERHTFAIHDLKLRSTISIGVSTVPDEGIDTPQDLLESADRALYEAKRSGKNRVAVANPKAPH